MYFHAKGGETGGVPAEACCVTEKEAMTLLTCGCYLNFITPHHGMLATCLSLSLSFDHQDDLGWFSF